MADDYNYSTFDLSRERPYFERFRDHLHAGERATDGELTDLESGERVSLSSLWSAGLALLEFGSFT